MNNDIHNIITQAKCGCRASFERLLRSHYSMMYRVAYRFTGHTSDAEDVVQEVCVALVDKLNSYNAKSSFTTWLYRVIVNQCSDFHKKRKSDSARDTQYVELEAMGAADARETSVPLQLI